MGYSASRSSNVLPPPPSERAPAPTLCSLGAPKLRNLLAAPCFYLSAFVTRLSAFVTIFSPVATNCPDYYVTRISLQLLPKTVKLPVFRCYYSACYQTFTAVLDSPESALVTRSSLMLATKLYQFFTTSLSLLPDFRCCPRQPRICPCYQILSRFATNCPRYQFFAATNLPLLPDFRCCPRQPRICPCYKILSLQLLRSLGPRPSPFHQNLPMLPDSLSHY